MAHYLIYKKSLIYMALYLKCATEKSKQTIVNLSELNNYILLVNKELTRQKNIARNFTYDIVDSDGYGNEEPNYNCSGRHQELIKSATYRYDPNKNHYVTMSTAEELSLKSTLGLPKPLSCCWLPQGFEKALNIPAEDEPGQ